jgi:hypothetical protein
MAPERRVLHYDDFEWRVRQVADERGPRPAPAAVAPVALARVYRGEGLEPAVTLLTFLYTYGEPDAEKNPTIFAPFARVQIHPDGTVAAYERYPDPEKPSPIGRMWSRIVLDSGIPPHGRRDLLKIHYDLITSDGGPLFESWDKLDPKRVQDLRDSFWRLRPEPSGRRLEQWLGRYAQHAEDFLRMLMP